MVTIDLENKHEWDELFHRVEAGETLRVTRGGKDIAVVQPTDSVVDDEAYLDFLAELGAKQIGAAFPVDEYADCGKKDNGNGTG